MRTRINWKVFFILWLAAILATVAILPYSLEIQSSVLATTRLAVPLPALLAIQVLQNAILFAIATFLGLLLAGPLGLGAPILDAATRGERVATRVRAILPLSIVLGLAGTLIVLGLEFLVFQPALARELADTANVLNLKTSQPAAWKGFLASFYGGIGEEILLRLFLMSLLAWLGRLVSRTARGKPASAVFWTANILAAVLFGLGHLPAISAIVPVTALVVVRTVVLNGILGVAWGWLYWKRGLEAAMISHFSADLVLHVWLAL